MTEAATVHDLKIIMAKETGLEAAKLDLDASIDSLGIASIDIVSMVFAIEDKYGVCMEAEDLPPAKTLGELLIGIIAIIEQRRNS